MCLWLLTCVYFHVCTEEVIFQQRCRILESCELLNRIEPKVRYLFFLLLRTCRFPHVAETQKNASSPFPLFSSPSSSSSSCPTSVPVLVFVVPAVEVYVKRHNAAGCHASDQSPESRAHRKSHLYTKLYTFSFTYLSF